MVQIMLLGEILINLKNPHIKSFLDGLVVMISACQLNNCKRGRPGFDSQSGSFFFFSLFIIHFHALL